MRNQRWKRDNYETKRSNQNRSNNRPSVLTSKQKRSLKDATSLPVSIIRNFHMYLDMRKITKTTPISVIVSNRLFPWDKRELVKKKDLRMIHTTYFDLNWDYYKLTISEPDKCNIAKYPDLKWDEKAIESIGHNVYCKNHLLSILIRYPTLNWNWYSLTSNMSLGIILKNMSLPWDNGAISDLLQAENDEECRMRVILKLSSNIIDWKRMTMITKWKTIGKYPELPWCYKYKHCCDCGEQCKYYLPLWVLRKLKNKPLDWEHITKCISYDTIYANKDIPWDEKTITSDIESVPTWFVMNTDYNWDTKAITKNSSWVTINDYPEFNWDENEMVSDEIDLPPVEILTRYPKVNWNWERYSREFSYADILNYKFLPWKWDVIVSRTNVPFYFAMEFRDKKWICDNMCADASETNIIRTLTFMKETFSTDISLIIFNKIY
jgi:hypothetical protein